MPGGPGIPLDKNAISSHQAHAGEGGLQQPLGCLPGRVPTLPGSREQRLSLPLHQGKGTRPTHQHHWRMCPGPASLKGQGIEGRPQKRKERLCSGIHVSPASPHHHQTRGQRGGLSQRRPLGGRKSPTIHPVPLAPTITPQPSSRQPLFPPPSSFQPAPLCSLKGLKSSHFPSAFGKARSFQFFSKRC